MATTTPDVPALLRKYQGNTTPAMIRVLAKSLGVAPRALKQLGLGYAPIVRFTKNTSYEGWWVTPEMDEEANPIGLSLRQTFDGKMKPMMPGTKHGLIYPVNPNYNPDRPDYVPGRHNWIRTTEAGVTCPICEHEISDGCLVSAEDPEDPKAAICIRVAEGAAQPMDFGYLHVLKEEGKITTGTGILPTSDHPIVIVEGMSDAAAAMSLGLVAVGRPSNVGGLGPLKKLVKGRSVIIVGEHDTKADGRSPGFEGMVATFTALKDVCPDAVMVLPPPEHKDLRAWYRSGELTASSFLEYVEENGRTDNHPTVLPDNDPTTLATAWLDDLHSDGTRILLRFYNKMWYRYSDGRYRPLDLEEDIRGGIYGWAKNKQYIFEDAQGKVVQRRLVCNISVVNNMLDALMEVCPVRIEQAPAWVNNAEGPDTKDLILFRNGMLSISKYLNGDDDYLIPNTPDLFSTFALDSDFDPDAQAPYWMKYLSTTFNDRPAEIALLQEWFGYCLTSDTSLHKCMLMRGPTRSGKSTAIQALQQIVGKPNSATVSLAQLGVKFGLETLPGKQIITIGDMRLPRSDASRAFEILLNISGGDEVNIERKYKPSLPNYHVGGRITMATNEFPDLPDHAGAFAARLNILSFPRRLKFHERNRELPILLEKEVPGMVLWALEGLRRLRAGKYAFTAPKDSLEALDEWRAATSPSMAFMEECCIEDEKHEILQQELYDAWVAWSEERGVRPGTKSKAFERLKGHAGCMISDVNIVDGRKVKKFIGLKLQPWAVREFIGGG